MTNTAPLIDYYVNRNKLVEVNGEQKIEAVGREMVAVLRSRVPQS